MPCWAPVCVWVVIHELIIWLTLYLSACRVSVCVCGQMSLREEVEAAQRELRARADMFSKREAELQVRVRSSGRRNGSVTVGEGELTCSANGMQSRRSGGQQ